ncbi:hypothetical protein OAA35_00560 [bacterium]|nr:hypothetical protein [bacterium]
MKKVCTLNENALFTQIEKNLFNEVLKGKAIRPKKTTIDTILNYSKALSVRESSIMNHIEMVLN